jgi:hypothetical protein
VDEQESLRDTRGNCRGKNAGIQECKLSCMMANFLTAEAKNEKFMRFALGDDGDSVSGDAGFDGGDDEMPLDQAAEGLSLQ